MLGPGSDNTVKNNWYSKKGRPSKRRRASEQEFVDDVQDLESEAGRFEVARLKAKEQIEQLRKRYNLGDEREGRTEGMHNDWKSFMEANDKLMRVHRDFPGRLGRKAV